MSLRQLGKTWNSFGEQDPLWAVLSHKDKRGNRWDLDEFLATGRKEIDDILDYARALHPDLPTGRALDFGCAVGRLTQALAVHFEEVHGIDIAPSMLARAETLNQHGQKCHYHHNEAPDLRLFATQSFDFIYSNITLQHMEPPLAHGYISEFCRLLSPDGMLVFQLPERPRRDSSAFARLRFRVLRWAYLLWHRHLKNRPIMDMFGTAKDRVAQLVDEAGCELIDIVETDASGPGWISQRYCARRAGLATSCQNNA